MNYHLENVEEMNRRYPSRFEIAPRADREQLRVGDLVKLILVLDQPSLSGASAERMWFELIKVKDGRYTGKLDNVPVVVDAHIEDVLEFGPEHVADYSLRAQLTKPLPSMARPGYVHPVGRHVSVEGSDGAGERIRVGIFTVERGHPDGGWNEEMVVTDQDALRWPPDMTPDPLDPRTVNQN